MFYILISLSLLVANSNCKVYFKEEFNDDKWEETWIHSEYAGKEFGKFVLSAGKFDGGPLISKGIKTSDDVRFYGLSTKFQPFSNRNNVLVLQFTVKHEQIIDCGGGYIKLYDCSLEPKQLHGETPYLIMFGPDICGYNKVHVIFNYKGKNLLIKKNITNETDVFTHLYTLIVNSDLTYVVKIDNIAVQTGELEDNWDFLSPRFIKDPNESKPEDWVDEPFIADVNDKKPEDWDQPEFLKDENASKPEDWDDDMDGEWEPPLIKNPAYKKEWKPRLLSNPSYRGLWIHPEIINPDYVPDPYLYVYDEICGVGFDLWQVKSGTIFDNIFIGDNEREAFRHSEMTWEAIKDKERKAKDELEKYPTPEEYGDKQEKEQDNVDDSDETVPEDGDQVKHSEL